MANEKRRHTEACGIANTEMAACLCPKGDRFCRIAVIGDVFNQLMRDFPINELLSATEIEQVHGAITHIFTHLNKVRNVKNYSGSKMKDLIGALGRDVTSQMLKILSG